MNSFSLAVASPKLGGKLEYTGQNHFTCLLTLAPFVSSADTLAKAKRLTHFYSVARSSKSGSLASRQAGTAFDLNFIV